MRVWRCGYDSVEVWGVEQPTFSSAENTSWNGTIIFLTAITFLPTSASPVVNSVNLLANATRSKPVCMCVWGGGGGGGGWGGVEEVYVSMRVCVKRVYIPLEYLAGNHDSIELKGYTC